VKEKDCQKSERKSRRSRESLPPVFGRGRRKRKEKKERRREEKDPPDSLSRFRFSLQLPFHFPLHHTDPLIKICAGDKDYSGASGCIT
jgi:hypothetical protein